MTPRAAKLIYLREELDKIEREHQNLIAVLFSGGIGLNDDEYWCAVDSQERLEDEHFRLDAQIFRLENELDAHDLADLEKADEEQTQYENQLAALRDRYKTERPQSIADFWL